MYNVLILWAPDLAETRKVAESVQIALNGGDFKTILKKADESSIVDITAADLLVLGLQKSGAVEVPPEYSELVRVFKGVTLAGRAAGVFSVGTERASAKMKRSLKDTEISLFEEDPVFSNEKPEKTQDISGWAKRLADFFQEVRSARE